MNTNIFFRFFFSEGHKDVTWVLVKKSVPSWVQVDNDPILPLIGLCYTSNTTLRIVQLQNTFKLL